VTIDLFVQEDRSPSGTGRALFQHDPIDTHFTQTSASTVQIRPFSPSTANPEPTPAKNREQRPTRSHWQTCAQQAPSATDHGSRLASAPKYVAP
jgi:hypothetical protein